MKIRVLLLSASILIAGAAWHPLRAQQRQKDYLTSTEADKIRDAETPSERIKLYISFAADRIKKLQYEFAHPGDAVHRTERLNALINSYSGCLDEASELIDLGAEKQQDIHAGIKDMQSQAPEFLAYLKQLSEKGADRDTYKDNLDDAVESTNDAINGASDAAKQIAPPPVRRKQ